MSWIPKASPPSASFTPETSFTCLLVTIESAVYCIPSTQAYFHVLSFFMSFSFFYYIEQKQSNNSFLRWTQLLERWELLFPQLHSFVLFLPLWSDFIFIFLWFLLWLYFLIIRVDSFSNKNRKIRRELSKVLLIVVVLMILLILLSLYVSLIFPLFAIVDDSFFKAFVRIFFKNMILNLFFLFSKPFHKLNYCSMTLKLDQEAVFFHLIMTFCLKNGGKVLAESRHLFIF